MPRYFFHVHDVEPSMDDIGEELADDEAAWHSATMFAGEVLQDVDGRFRPGQEWSLEVTNQAGKSIYFINIGSRKMK